jgi:hypothetical protein
MRTPLFLTIYVLFLGAFSGVFGQFQTASAGTASASAARAGFMPLSELREGMKGTARTVFRGEQPEEFNVEILGVVPGAIGPRQDLIIGRISGGGADRTSVFAGMSGSPVYVNGRLVGAISYSFPFSKEPICGITPIEQMVSIFEQRGSEKRAAESTPVSFAELASTGWEQNLPKNPAATGLVSGFRQDSALMAVAGQTFQPIATPLTFNGVRQEALDLFAPQLLKAGLLPVAAVGGSAPMSPMKKADETTLVGGDSVSMQLTRGDYSLAAAGTVTYRDGEKIYAFGHPFLSLGTSELPMSESHVVAVVPSVNNSFKLAVPDAMVGTMTQDRATGVYGRLGQAPKMIPVRINLKTSRGQVETTNFEVAADDFLTPLLLNITIYNTLIAQERGLGDSTISINGKIDVAGQQPIAIERRFAGASAGQLAAGSVAAPVAVLLRSRFEDLRLSGITLDLSAADGAKTAAIERIAVDRTQVKAGETVEVTAFARTPAGRVFVQKIPVSIPAGTAPGNVTITVADGTTIQASAPIQKFVPTSASDLIGIINNVKLADRLYAQVSRTSSGAIIGSSELPNLPPSVLATLNNDRTAGGIQASVLSILAETPVAPAEFIISGQQALTVEVVR